MGRPTLPDISSVSEVIDLITNPDKYVTYMQEFRRIHQETVYALGDLATKEKLDAAVAKLAADKTAFEQEKADASDGVAAEVKDLAKSRNLLDEDIKTFCKAAKKEDDELEVKARSIDQRYAEADKFVKEQEVLWLAKHAENEQEKKNWEYKQSVLDAALAKITPVAKALGVSLE